MSEKKIYSYFLEKDIYLFGSNNIIVVNREYLTQQLGDCPSSQEGCFNWIHSAISLHEYLLDREKTNAISHILQYPQIKYPMDVRGYLMGEVCYTVAKNRNFFAPEEGRERPKIIDDCCSKVDMLRSMGLMNDNNADAVLSMCQ